MQRLYRLLLFILQKLLIILAVAGVLLLAFTMSSAYSNIYMMITGGLEARANVVLMGQSPAELTKFFTPEFVAQDPLLQSNRYVDYNINSFHQTVELGYLLPWPWQDTVTAEITYRMVRITGDLRSDKKTQEQREKKEKVPVPLWPDVKYRVVMVRQGGVWKISSMEQIEVVPKNPLKATPTMSFPNLPTPTPTPTAPLSPSPSVSPSPAT